MIPRVYFLLCWITPSSIPLVGATEIRLMDGTQPYNGRVEVWHNGAWGTVCADYFDDLAAQVACRQLGYTDLSQAISQGTGMYDFGDNNIILDDVQCNGHEESLFDCPHGGLYNHNCWYLLDVGITCASDTGNGCLENPPCNSSCFFTELVTPVEAPCPICVCAACPDPTCPIGCESGQTEFFDGEACVECRCAAVTEEPPPDDSDTLDTGTVVAIAVVVVAVPVIALSVFLVFKTKSHRRRRRVVNVKAKAPKAPATQSGEVPLPVPVPPPILLPPESEIPMPGVADTGK